MRTRPGTTPEPAPPRSLPVSSGATDHQLIVLRPMEADDCAWVAALHAQQFADGFLARLGEDVLCAYYAAVRASPAAVTLVADGPAGPAGYLLGTSDTAAHRRYVVRRRSWRIAVAVGLALGRSPRLAGPFVRTKLLRWTRRTLTSAVPDLRPGQADGSLCYLVTTPQARGQGVGTALVRRFESDLRRRGTRTARLVTAARPSGAGPFYARLGWRCSGSVLTSDGRALDVWTTEL